MTSVGLYSVTTFPVRKQSTEVGTDRSAVQIDIIDWGDDSGAEQLAGATTNTATSNRNDVNEELTTWDNL